MDENIMLRCKHCGAPFEPSALDKDSPYVTCTSCGTSQQRVDARKYLEEMMGFVQSWISSAIPMGFSMSQAENVDSVARHNIFVRNIQPRIESGLMEYKFANNNLLANPLLTLPFMAVILRTPSKTSAQAFEFNASVRSVSALAVDENSKRLVNDAATISQAYALMMNNARLLSEDKDGRFILMANNFAETARVFEGIRGYEAMRDRFRGLASVTNGMGMLLEGSIVNAAPMVKEGISVIEKAKAAVMSSPEFSITYQAVEQELSVANAVNGLIDMIQINPSADVMRTLDMIRRVVRQGLVNSGMWSGLLGNLYRYTEIFDEITKVFKAKNGDAAINVAAGGGNWLMPFWMIDLEYSFITGALWAKKSVEVKEVLFAPADFVCDVGLVNNPSYAITDIFSLRPAKSILAGIKGSETSISAGEGLETIAGSVSAGSAGSRNVILPLSTGKEAAKLASEYLVQRTQQDQQLKLSKPRVRGLVYIPCDVVNDTVKLPGEFGALVPARVRNMRGSALLYV